MRKYLYNGRVFTDIELVDEAIQLQADINNRDLIPEKVEEIWNIDVEIIDEPFKVVTEFLPIKEFDKNYAHCIFRCPFKGNESLIYVMDYLVYVAFFEVLNVADSYAYAYAMSVFGTDFFSRFIEIKYIYETKEDWDYGVPLNVTWSLEGVK